MVGVDSSAVLDGRVDSSNTVDVVDSNAAVDSTVDVVMMDDGVGLTICGVVLSVAAGSMVEERDVTKLLFVIVSSDK